MTQYKDLDPLLHSQLRLAIISLLFGVESAEFTYLKEKTSVNGSLSERLPTSTNTPGFI